VFKNVEIVTEFLIWLSYCPICLLRLSVDYPLISLTSTTSKICAKLSKSRLWWCRTRDITVQNVPETKRAANDACRCIIESTVTHCSPLAIIVHFKTSLSCSWASRQSYCKRHVYCLIFMSVRMRTNSKTNDNDRFFLHFLRFPRVNVLNYCIDVARIISAG